MKELFFYQKVIENPCSVVQEFVQAIGHARSKCVCLHGNVMDVCGIILLRYDLTDTAGVLENKVLGMFHGLDD